MKRLAATSSQTQDTSGLSHQCSATEPRQLDNHLPSTWKNSSWNPRGERKKITMDEHQPAWKLGSGNPLGERKKITADENQPARKVGSCTPRKEKEDIADEHQPAQKVGSWNPWGERKKITADEHQPAWKVDSWNPFKPVLFYPRETGSNDAERTPWSKLGNPWFHPRRVINLLYFGCG